MTDQQQNTCVGKYRGKVVHNVDPLLLGRIIATVPALPEPLLNWALPCFPYAGPNVGLFAVPPIGANVWIEFEGGDPAYAIWTGCFRDAEDRPSSTQLPPHLKMFRTDSITILLGKGDGTFTTGAAIYGMDHRIDGMDPITAR